APSGDGTQRDPVALGEAALVHLGAQRLDRSARSVVAVRAGAFAYREGAGSVVGGTGPAPRRPRGRGRLRLAAAASPRSAVPITATPLAGAPPDAAQPPPNWMYWGTSPPSLAPVAATQPGMPPTMPQTPPFVVHSLGASSTLPSQLSSLPLH